MSCGNFSDFSRLDDVVEVILGGKVDHDVSIHPAYLRRKKNYVPSVIDDACKSDMSADIKYENRNTFFFTASALLYKAKPRALVSSSREPLFPRYRSSSLLPRVLYKENAQINYLREDTTHC